MVGGTKVTDDIAQCKLTALCPISKEISAEGAVATDRFVLDGPAGLCPLSVGAFGVTLAAETVVS